MNEPIQKEQRDPRRQILDQAKRKLRPWSNSRLNQVVDLPEFPLDSLEAIRSDWSEHANQTIGKLIKP